MGNPVDGREYYDPPLAQAPGTGAFTGGLFLSSADVADIRTVEVSGEEDGAGVLTGTMEFTTYFPSCTGSVEWNASLAAVGGVAGPPEVAPASGRSWWGLAPAIVVAMAVAGLALARRAGRRRLS
jgi:hypothetical protein